MDEWEKLKIKIQEVEGMNSEIRHLSSVLERDPVWVQRHEVAEPGRSQLLKIEERLLKMRNMLNSSDASCQKFLEAYSITRPLLEIGMLPTAEMEEGFQEMMEATTETLESSVEARNSLIQIINELRRAQNLPSLDGGLSPLN